ncbi:phage portal protein [Streptomyces phaeochromogenes]|uniref:phage portal protein n=1 Tax=Streptomyces phaeochromogenes TaxID=1923 RepID=UPI002DDC6D02|nr:phage portal protein [Streptomyces phaeochromogenes]WRZ30181.1 phage portal protein [Streptomyces phaeochromogenes]
MERTELEWLDHLVSCHDKVKADLKRLDSYYEGTQPLSYMAPELERELSESVRQVVINWPRLVVDAIEERLDVTGFRFPGEAQADEELWRIWQANDLDEQSQQGHLDALVMKRSYVVVGTNEADKTTPIITVESALDMYAEHDPRTRKVAAAVKRWCEGEGKDEVEHATLYLPNATIWYLKEDDQWIQDPAYPRDDHNLGVVLVEVLANRPRLKKRNGVSELADVIPLSDAACKIATDMMISAEYHATPRRVAFGFGEEDFVDEHGRKISAWSRIAGRIWATEKNRKDHGADVVQFPEADLKNFHSTINQLAELVASLIGMPPHFMGRSTANPASADAIRSSESRLVKRAERKQGAWGGTWERVMRLVLLVRDGKANAEARSLETIWRDASTPTVAQAADAAVKKKQAGIVPLRQTREDLGYTQAQIARMEEQDERDAQSAMRRITGGDVTPLFGTKDPPEPVPDDVLPEASSGNAA